MYVYEMGFPIDFFGFMRKVDEVYQRLLVDDAEGFEFAMTASELRHFLRRSLRNLAIMHTHWEGDVLGGLYIGSLPGNDDYCNTYEFIVLKQSHNGSSYIISQVEFPHLHRNLVKTPLGKPVSQKIQDGMSIILAAFTPLRREIDPKCEVL